MSGMPPGVVIGVCPVCNKAQDSSKKGTETETQGLDSMQECNNPDCKSKLFNQAAMKECTICSTSINTDTSPQDKDEQKQHISEQDSSQEEPKLECSNLKCKFGLYNETATVQCGGCNTANQTSAEGGSSSSNPQPPTCHSESMDVSPPVSETNLQSHSEVKNISDEATNSDQKSASPTAEKKLQHTESSGSGLNFQPSSSDGSDVKPQSAPPEPLECINPDCKEILFTGNIKFCHKCLPQQSDPNLTGNQGKQISRPLKTEIPPAHDPTTPMEITIEDTPRDKPDDKGSSVDLMDTSDSLKDSPGNKKVPHSHPGNGQREKLQADKSQSESGLSESERISAVSDTLTRSSLDASRARGGRKRPNGSNEHTNKLTKLSTNDQEEGSRVDEESGNPTPQSYSTVVAKNGAASGQQPQVLIYIAWKY